MNWNFPLYAIAYPLNVLFAIWLALTIWRRSRTRSGKVFSVFLLLVAIWTFLRMMETILLPMPEKLFWARLQYIPIVGSGPVWLQFCYEHQNQRKLSIPGLGLLWVIPALTLAFLFNPQTTFLIWSKINPPSIPGLQVLLYEHGPWFWVIVIYTYLLILFGAWILLQGRRDTQSVFRKQALALLGGLLLPIGGNLLYLSWFNPLPGLDWTPFGFSLTALIYAISLFRLHLFDLSPISSQQVLHHIRDALLVLDDQQRLVEANSAAQQLLNLPTHWAGLSIKETGRFELSPQADEKTQVRIFHRNDHCFELRSLPLAAGRLLILRDVTQQQRLQDELRESKESYQRLIELSPEMICVHAAGKILYVNPTGATLIGAANAEELIGRPLLSFVHPDDRAAVIERVHRTETQKQVTEWIEERFLHLDGSPLPVEVISAPILYHGTTATLVLAHDIQKRKAAEQAETEQRQLVEALSRTADALNSTLQLDEVLNRILDGVGGIVPNDAVSLMMLEGNNVIITHSRGYLERGLEEYVRGFCVPLSELATLRHIIETGQTLVIPHTVESPLWMQLNDGCWIQSYMGAPINIKGEIVGFLNLDSVTPNFYTPQHAKRLQAFLNQAATAIENARLYREVQQLAIMDELTGLYNRRGLLAAGEKEIERSRRYHHNLSILFMDVDHFKQFNDTYSYAVGDRALRHVADALRHILREMDIIGRYGGDEFVVLLPNTFTNDARLIATRIQAHLNENPLQVRQGNLPVNVSIGIYDLPNQDTPLLSLLETAGQIMHQAKQNYSGIASL